MNKVFACFLGRSVELYMQFRSHCARQVLRLLRSPETFDVEGLVESPYSGLERGYVDQRKLSNFVI